MSRLPPEGGKKQVWNPEKGPCSSAPTGPGAPLYLNTTLSRLSDFMSFPPHLTIILWATALLYDCSPHASLRGWPRTRRCPLNVCWKTTPTKQHLLIQSLLLKGRLKSSNHLPWNFWLRFPSLRPQRRKLCLLPENLQSCHVDPTFIARHFYTWLPILPPSRKLSFFLLLVLLSKMLLIKSGCDK